MFFYVLLHSPECLSGVRRIQRKAVPAELFPSHLQNPLIALSVSALAVAQFQLISTLPSLRLLDMILRKKIGNAALHDADGAVVLSG